MDWTAPETTKLAFHLAALAGNDDQSPLGDTALEYSVNVVAQRN